MKYLVYKEIEADSEQEAIKKFRYSEPYLPTVLKEKDYKFVIQLLESIFRKGE